MKSLENIGFPRIFKTFYYGGDGEIISLALCAVLLLSIMVTAISAEDVKYKIDPRSLEEYGKKTYIVGEAIATAPIVDGKVQANEYSLKVETTLDKDYDDQDAAPTGAAWTIEWANYFVAYDDECLYLAADVHDPDHTVYGQWVDNVKRGDQFCFAIGGMWYEPTNPTWDPITALASRLEFRFFDGNTEEEKAKTGHEDFFEIQDAEKDFMGTNVSGDYLDSAVYTKAHKVEHNADTGVTTYEVAINWSALEKVWPHHEGSVQFDLITFGTYIQDTVNEEIPVGEDGKVMGHRPGIRWWGTKGEGAEAAYNLLLDEYTSAAKYGPDDKIIPNMLFFGTEAEYAEYKASQLVIDEPETEAPETEEIVDDPAGETNAPETDAANDDKPAKDNKDEAEGGCGSSVAALGVALVAALGTCTAFVSKKR